MRKINTYILEKLHLNKNLNIINNEIEPNKFIFGLSLFGVFNLSKGTITVMCYSYPFVCKELDDKIITYDLHDNNYGERTLLKMEYFVNSNNFYEWHKHDQMGLFLNIENGLKFLNDVKKNNCQIDINLLKNYVDSKTIDQIGYKNNGKKRIIKWGSYNADIDQLIKIYELASHEQPE